MKSKEFRQWHENLFLTQERAAQLLYVSRVTIIRYETIGKIPKTIALASITLDIAFFVVARNETLYTQQVNR